MPIDPVDLADGADPGGEVPDLLQLTRVDKPTAHDARLANQFRTFALGYHPVGNVYGLSLRLHPAAPFVADRAGPGPRCGNCTFWAIPKRLRRRSRKCTKPPHAYLPAGPASFGTPDEPRSGTSKGRGPDVAEWWPACIDWKPADESP